MTKEQDFWNRILELAHAQLKQTTYDFFVAEAKLVKVEEKQAVIFLDSPVKQLFWEQNLVLLQDLIFLMFRMLESIFLKKLLTLKLRNL